MRTSLKDHLLVINTGSGRFANYDSEVLLGLESNEVVNSVEVILPSGQKLEFRQPFKMMSSNSLILDK
jgi:hypothetical protein